MTALIGARGFTPTGSNLLVRLTSVPERTEGGIILPDTMREQWQDAEVVAKGEGRCYVWPESPEAYQRYQYLRPMWASVGDRVVFRKHDLRMIDLPEKLGILPAESLLGLVDADGEVTPLGEWVLLELPPRRTETEGGIALPEMKQQRPNCGIMLRYGPGRLRERGPLFGTRLSVPEICGLPRSTGLTGYYVHFSAFAEVLDVGHGSVERWLLKASDLVAIEEAD